MIRKPPQTDALRAKMSTGEKKSQNLLFLEGASPGPLINEGKSGGRSGVAMRERKGERAPRPRAGFVGEGQLDRTRKSSTYMPSRLLILGEASFL